MTLHVLVFDTSDPVSLTVELKAKAVEVLKAAFKNIQGITFDGLHLKKGDQDLDLEKTLEEQGVKDGDKLSISEGNISPAIEKSSTMIRRTDSIPISPPPNLDELVQNLKEAFPSFEVDFIKEVLKDSLYDPNQTATKLANLLNNRDPKKPSQFNQEQLEEIKKLAKIYREKCPDEDEKECFGLAVQYYVGCNRNFQETKELIENL